MDEDDEWEVECEVELEEVLVARMASGDWRSGDCLLEIRVPVRIVKSAFGRDLISDKSARSDYQHILVPDQRLS